MESRSSATDNGSPEVGQDCPMLKKSSPPDVDLYDSIVTIRFEDDEKAEFMVHRGLICYHSSFFRGALLGSFVEAHDRAITLPAEDVVAFKVFMRWMYTMRLFNLGTDISSAIKGDESHDLMATYIFADERSIPALKNAIVDLLIDNSVHDNFIPMHLLPQAWDHLPESDKLRRLFVDWICLSDLDLESFNKPNNEIVEKHPHDFLAEVVKRVIHPELRPVFRKDSEWLQQKCLYHDHAGAQVGGNQPLKDI